MSSVKTRSAVEWAPSIYKSTTVVTERGSAADVVTLWGRCIDSKGKRADRYHTYISYGAMQMGYSRKDGDYYHKRMCEIAKERLEELEKHDDEEDEEED